MIDTLKEKCFGCSACLNICPVNAISMVQNNEGFLEPLVDKEKCINCERCLKICPANQLYLKNSKEKAFAVIHKDNVVRANSVSGGAFTALSDAIFEKNGIVYGVVYDNLYAKHVRAENSIERDKMRGSKYVQSDLTNTFNSIKDDLVKDTFVLFVGTSCQVDGLVRFLGENSVDTSKLYTVEIVCHGVPSPLIFKEHLNYLEKKNGKKIIAYKNRSKVKGWHEHNEEITYENNKKEWKTKSAQNFKDIFYKNLILRKSCYSCPYAGKMGIADIAIGDFWGVQHILPKIDDNKGVSILLTSSIKGEELFESIKEEVLYYQVDNEKALIYNHNKPCKVPATRELFWKDYNKFGYDYVAKKYANDTFLGRIKFYIKTRLRRILVKLNLKDK
ncbi:MAG: 4Fe-4S dicluster domain-containing protein [Clostridiales bacterium]|nr:4Fe-4S dicluster domain-containing protein [Clostridiales bacterium]